LIIRLADARVVMALHLAGYKDDEIAERLDVTAETVRSTRRYLATLQALHCRVRQFGGPPPQHAHSGPRLPGPYEQAERRR
jgi:transposase